MKSLQDYINTYRKVADGLGISGDSTELLIQLLANASYISEVENIAYSQEASLERATTINSKIQHCINNMYSVYRGQCPRMILNIKPTKIINWTQYDVIMSSNNFKVYYLGYYDSDDNNIFKETTLSHYPIGEDEGKTIKVLCLLAKETFSLSEKIQNTNRYYIDILENNLSNDIQVTIDNSIKKVTRQFSEHILGETNGETKLFDLTLPGFGSRIYFNDLSNKKVEEQNQNSVIEVLYFKRSKLVDYNESELKNISLKGIEIIDFDKEWLTSKNYVEFMPGKILIPEVDSDDMLSIHYKANQIRHLGSVFKSNYDLGNLLQQRYPANVKDTSVVFENIENKLTIYYIPISLLSTGDIQEFNTNNKAYYIIEDIDVIPGVVYNINFDIEVNLYETGDVSNQINEILQNFADKFNVNFIKDTKNLLLRTNSKYSDIEAQISKNALVKRINKLNIQYTTESGESFEEELANDLWNLMIEDLMQGRAYYKISSTINQIIQ